LSKLGQWRFSGEGRVIAVSSGVVAVESKDPEQVADFSLRFSWLYEQARKNPNLIEYQMEKWSPMTLKKSCKLNKLEKLGQMEHIIRSIDLNVDEKRLYPVNPKNGRMLLHSQYKSMPLDISVVMTKGEGEEDEDEE